MNMKTKRLTEFFANEIRDYSVYACQRAIPSGIDGLKPSQRKVLFGMMKEYPTAEVKVSIASASIMGISAYHHGSLDGVMVNMAQSFPGSNNAPLLEGIGQFGSRITPIPAASRYIFTKMSKVSKSLILPVDDNILTWLDDDGVKIEPEFYLPILPLVLINGAEGMGTGFATSIMSYKPEDLKNKIIGILNGKTKTKPLVPWYNGFSGDITRNAEGQTVITGKLEVINSTTIKITELPIGTFTIKYREVLNKLEDAGTIKSYDDNSAEDKIEFIVRVPRETAARSHEDLIKLFKLVSRNTENIVVWNQFKKIQRFASADDLLTWFVDYRLSRYGDRRDYLLNSIQTTIDKYENQARFIKLYLKKSSIWAKTKTEDILQELRDDKFDTPEELLNIRINKLTGDAILDLQDKIASSKKELTRLQTVTNKDMYLEDLAKL